MAASEQIERIRQKIESFKTEIEAYFETLPKEDNSAQVKENLSVYVLLIGALSSFRRLPGVTEHMGFEGDYVCPKEEDRQELKGYLEQTYGLESEENLYDNMRILFHADAEYADFVSFMAGDPAFDIEQMSDEERNAFEASKSFVEGFIDSVGEGGFLAWDVGERIGILRAARACELISSELFFLAVHQESRIATELFDSWASFIVSALWGSVYYMFVNMERQETPELEAFLDLNIGIARRLVFEDKVWVPSTWINTKLKLLAIDPDSMFNYLENWQGPDVCLASDRILVDGYGVGFMMHQAPQHEEDSGWRFFMGGEDTFINQDNEDQYSFVPLNWVCNYDPEIVPFLGHTDEVAFVRDNKGIWRYVNDVDENGNWLGLPPNGSNYATPLPTADNTEYTEEYEDQDESELDADDTEYPQEEDAQEEAEQDSETAPVSNRATPDIEPPMG